MHKGSKNNLYYPVFRNLENETIRLSQGIYFSDEQLNVYSIKISELLSRCLTEIESLYKDLYRREKGSSPSTIGDAWRYLDSQWKLEQKELSITSDNFFFDSAFTPYLRPFAYDNKSVDDFYSAYNAVKHDRAKSLSKANLNVLIRALGALYILNLYYSERNLVSDIFTPKTAERTVGIFLSLGVNLKSFMDTCLFIEHLEFDYYLWQEAHAKDYSEMINALSKANQEEFELEITEKHSNTPASLSTLLRLHDPEIAVGKSIIDAHNVAKPLIEGEALLSVNTGYDRVYMTTDELLAPLADAGKGDKVVALEHLKTTLPQN